MKNTSLVITSMMVWVSTFCLITWNGSSEAWAKGPGGGHRTTSNITQPSNTQGSPSVSSNNNVQDSKSGKGTKQQDRSIEISDYGFGVSMPVTSSRSDGGGATVGR